MEKFKEKSSRPLRPATVIALSFLIIIFLGTLLFRLPFMTRDGKGLPFFTGLFTATSSVCVTGLTVIDPAVTLSRFGQVLMAVLIEIGGISMVTFASFLLFTFRKRYGLRSMRLAQEYTNVDTFSQVKPLVRTIIATAVICQLTGALLLCIRFVPKLGPKGIWVSVFTAISAYCNAGFDLFGIEQEYGSLIHYNGDPLVMYVVMALIVTGGIGFFVFYDLIHLKKTKHISLHTKVVAVTSLILIVVGFVSILSFEHANPNTLGPMSAGEKFTAALFQSITTRTAGFSSVDIASLHDVTKIIMMLLMFIGAGSGSTGGGIKVTTFAVIAMTAVSVIKNRGDTVIFGKKVDKKVVYKSFTIAMLGLVATFIAACFMLVDIPDANGIDVFFEGISAFATVGLSSGITAMLGKIGLCALIVLMFIGRLGPVCFIVALNIREEKDSANIHPEGKIMVG